MTAVRSPQPMRRARNVALLLAKLETKSPQYGGSGYSGPALETAQDVAAALGMAARGGAGPRLAVAVLCLRLWPSMFYGAEVTARQHVIVSTGRRAGKSFAALTHRSALLAILGMLERQLRTGIVFEGEKADSALAAHLWEVVRSRRPPPVPRDYPAMPVSTRSKVLAPEFLSRWSRALVDEFQHPNRCQVCAGYGETIKLEPVGARKTIAVTAPCTVCLAQGTVPWAKHRRAKAVSIGVPEWRYYLDRHHTDVLAILRDLESRGASAVLRALGDADSTS